MEKKYLWGMDISMTQTGLAIYDLDEKKFVHIDSCNTDHIKATKIYKNMNLHSLKLKYIADWLKPALKEYPPYLVSMEGLIYTGFNEFRVLAKTYGVIQCMLWNKPQVDYKPKEAKAIIYKGDASKEEIRDEILKRYPDLVMKNLDESDAVSIALCPLISNGFIEWEKTPLPEKPKKPRARKKKE